MGELLSEQIRKPGERDQTLHDERFGPKLSDLGIEKTESHRYQQIATFFTKTAYQKPCEPRLGSLYRNKQDTHGTGI